MRIVLFRHGHAGERNARRWPDDSVRPLTAKGRERTRAAAMGLKRALGETEITIHSSPFTRCAQAAEIVREVFAAGEVIMNPELAPTGSFRRILEALNKLKRNATVVVIGHEPDLGKLAGTLLFGAPRPLPMRKSGACVLAFVSDLKAGGAQLEGFYPPRFLRRLAGKKAKA
jgi:phosphohistidine phosphatase